MILTNEQIDALNLNASGAVHKLAESHRAANAEIQISQRLIHHLRLAGGIKKSLKEWDRARISELEEALRGLRALVGEQGGNDGLWFKAKTAPEAYLQNELRRLHAAIEVAGIEDE